MFRTLNHRYFLPLLIVLFVFPSGLSGQVPEHEVPDLRQGAMSNYAQGNYAVAEEAFSKLILQFPRDAMYRYYAGICLLEQNKDLNEAVELLYYASTRGVPEDVYFYLGEAYRKMYDFERAKKYYITFDKEAPRSMSRARDSKLLIRSINAAMQITSMYNPFEVQNVTFIDLRDPEQAGQIRMKGGDLGTKPAVFFSENEEHGDLNSLMFMPKTPVRGQKVYFASLERNGRNGFQIMQAKRGNTGKWTDIKPIDILNTGQDELLPYYDPVGKDIYFASDGREGLGGFDLYRSHYDEERDEWSDPVSLGFPVNSAFDDYLLLPGTDLGMVTFFSARQVSDTAVAVYRVHLSEPKESLASKSPQEIMKIANLGGVAGDMKKEFEAYKELLTESDKNADAVSASPQGRNDRVAPVIPAAGKTGNAEPAHPQETVRTQGGNDQAYQELISTALRHQAATDSLTELATAARIRVRESDDPNEKWLNQRQIMVWEKKVSQEQEQADIYFARVAEYQQTPTPGVIEKDTVINDITVYRFADQGMETADVTTTPDVEEKAKAAFGGNDQQPVREEVAPPKQQGTEAPARKENDVQAQKTDPGSTERADNRFEIRPESPYSAANPIAVDVALPKGTLYRIQLGVYSDKVDPSVFGGIYPVNALTDSDRGLVFYYAGHFPTYEEAMDALASVRSEGFSDAFVVAWFNGAKMSIEKARKLEK